jgi:hypothetical protein
VLITNEFHEFYWSTISGTSDDGKASYGPKSMHIFNMLKIRHSHREYYTRGWCGTKLGPNRAKVGPVGPTSLVGQPGVGAFSNFALPTYQGRSVPGTSRGSNNATKSELVKQDRCADLKDSVTHSFKLPMIYWGGCAFWICEGLLCTETISPSTRNACTAVVEEVVA